MLRQGNSSIVERLLKLEQKDATSKYKDKCNSNQPWAVFMDSKKKKKDVTVWGCLRGVDIIKRNCLGRLDSLDSHLLRRSPHIAGARPPGLCVCTVDVSASLCPGGLFVGGLFCFHSVQIWTCSPLPCLVHLP